MYLIGRWSDYGRSARLLGALIALVSVVERVAANDQSEGFMALFNGKDLTDWRGDLSRWSVQDGAITGQTTAERPLTANTFLLWRDEVADFELRLRFRLIANNDEPFANSGLQYRSHMVDAASWTLGGYQLDMDFAHRFTGMLFEEKGRGIVMQPGQSIRLEPVGPDGKPRISSTAPSQDIDVLRASMHRGDWNDAVVIAQGRHLRHYVNGKLTADVLDLDPVKGALRGLLALQLHRGQPMTVQFKDILIKILPSETPP